MGRQREVNIGDPPYLHRKGDVWYHVSGTVPRKWTALGRNKQVAIQRCEEIERQSNPPEELTHEKAAAQQLLELIDRYWALAYAEGKEGREHDTEDGAAQQTRSEIERIIRNAFGAPAAWKMPEAPELLAFINATPLAQSLLYDLNLLPECITDALGWMRMAAVCEHLRQALAPAPSGLDPQMGFLLDGANAGELAAYDYGCAQSMDAVQRVLDGKDDGRGVANAPWEPLRRRLLALVASASAPAPADKPIK